MEYIFALIITISIYLIRGVISYLRLIKTNNLFLFELSLVLIKGDFHFILFISIYYLDVLTKYHFF